MANRREERDLERRREAEEALRRVARDTETIGDSATRGMLGRAGDHFSAADADPSDKVDLWGKRIGRVLALLAVTALLYHIVTTYLVR